MTVTQISRQQRASYRPEIAFSRVFFEASTKDAKLPTRWANWGKKRGESPLQDDRLSVPLANIRLATAKDVSLRWSFPFDRAVQQVNELAQQELVPIYLQFDDKGLHLDSTFFRYGSNWQNQRDKSWDYVLPVSIEPTSTLVEIPHAYILLVSAIIYIMHKNMKLGAVPPISVDLMFADVAGNRYKSSFQFNIDWHDLSCSRDGLAPSAPSAPSVALSQKNAKHRSLCGSFPEYQRQITGSPSASSPSDFKAGRRKLTDIGHRDRLRARRRCS